MTKQNADKLLNIRMPQRLLKKFRAKCTKNYKTMSEALRDLIQEYLRRQH